MPKVITKLSFVINNIYVKNALVLLSNNIIKILVGFVISVFIARYFGPGRFGQINYVGALISILQVFVFLGFDSIILKDISLKLYPESMIFGTAVKSRLVSAGIIYCIGLGIFYFFFDKSLIAIYLIMGTELFAASFSNVFKQWFESNSLNKYIVIASQISFFVVSATKIIIIILAKEIIWYAGILAIGTFIEAILLYLFFRKKAFCVHIGKFNTVYFKKLFHSSWPLIFQSFAIVIYMKIDQIMIGKMLSAYELGIYSIGVSISELIYFVPMAIAHAAYPKVAQTKNDNKDYESIIVRIGSYNVLICLLFAVGCTLFAAPLVKIVYGDAYIPAGRVIQIHSWASIFVAIGCSHSCYLIFNNLQKYSLIGTGIAAVLNVILNVIFIRLWGITGAASATVLAQLFSAYLFFYFVNNKKIFVLRTKSLFLRGIYHAAQ